MSDRLLVVQVLKTPSLNFNEPENFPKGWSQQLVTDKRFQRITSPFLLEKGAKWYCWLLPGEQLFPADEHDEPPAVHGLDQTIHRSETNPQRTQSPIPWESGEPWSPCSHGGFVYLFSEDQSDSSVRDCFYDVNDVSSASVSPSEAKQFPHTLGPFGLAPSQILPDLDAESGTFCVDSVECFTADGSVDVNPQLQKLKEFGFFPMKVSKQVIC